MISRYPGIIMTRLVSTFASLFFCPIILAAGIGVLGIYQADDNEALEQSLVVFERDLNKHACILRREGGLANSQGSLDLGDPNRFFILECDSSVLPVDAATPVVAAFLDTATNMKLVEGKLDQFETARLSDEGSGREYIIKLSHFNNQTPGKRHSDLNLLDELAKKREDHYVLEGFIDVQRAQGLRRPDEVVVISYSSPIAAHRFRENNADLMDKIGKFNVDHLSEFVYLSGMSSR